MTFAPANLTAVRRLLLDHCPGLAPAEVGIVGDPAHRGGYHCGRDRLDSDDYSVRESSRDRNGLTEAASALDIGQWSARVGGKAHSLASMSMWLVAQCKAGTADSKDIREIIYSPDGTVVRRWDRLGRRSSGDSSHRWHTHISYHRDATKAGRDLTALYRRYLTSIGILEDDMTPAEFADILDNPAVAQRLRAIAVQYPVFPDRSLLTVVQQGDQRTARIEQALAQLAARPPVQAAPVDVDQLAAALRPYVEAAAESAVRRVLGAVDGATPAGG
jgi:hypothetical protein